MANGVNNQYPILDGIAPSWADVKLTISATGAPLLRMIAIKAIKSSRSVERGKQRGLAGGQIVQRTTGQGDQDATLTLYTVGWDQMQDTLSNIAPKRGDECLIGLVHFDIRQIWTPPGSNKIYERQLLGCLIAGDSGDTAEGSDPDAVEVPISPGKIINIVNGKKVVLI